MKLTPFHAAPCKQIAAIVGMVCMTLAFGSVIFAWFGAGGVALPSAPGWTISGSALCLLLVSASLLFGLIARSRWASGIARVLSAACGAIAAVSWIGYVAGSSTEPFDHLFGMAPDTALAFLLLAAALQCLPSKRASLARIGQGLAVAAMALALLAIIGHLYGTPHLFAPGSLGHMRPAVAIGITLAALGVLAERVDVGLSALFVSRGPGGLLARRLILPVLLVPVGVGWLVLESERRGLHPASTAIAVLVTAVAIVQFSVGLALASRLERLGRGYLRSLDDGRRSREALQQAEERLRLTVQCGAIGAWQFDASTNRVSANQRCQEMFGLQLQPDHELERYLERLLPEDRPRVEAALERSLDPASGGGYDIEYRVAVPDRERWIRATGQAFFDAKGQPERMFGTVSDITDNKLARQNAEASSRAKDEFLAVLGHELRNPLSPILTALELMKLRADAAFPRERSVIERQVQHMVRLVDDLLDVSRIARGKVDLKRRPVQIASVIEGSIELTSPLFEQKRHRLRVDVPQQGLVVYGDEHRLVQVVSNLLSNAGKYTPPEGTIDVCARANGGCVVISVRDNGIGIPDHLLPRLFDLFAQGPRVIERSQGGLGLGLAIAKNLVEMHGGSIGAQSAGAGCGSEFTVSLPLELGVERAEPARGASRAASAGDDAERRKRRVLVVDDNPDTAETLAEILRFDEHEVSVAYDGPSALVLARQQRFDLAFLDIGLPVMDGYELARQLRRLEGGDKLVLVAVTGYGQDTDRRHSEAAGFDGHLVKPVEPVRVLSIASEPSQASLGL